MKIAIDFLFFALEGLGTFPIKFIPEVGRLLVEKGVTVRDGTLVFIISISVCSGVRAILGTG